MKTEINVNNTEAIYRSKNEVNSLLKFWIPLRPEWNPESDVRKSFALDLLYLWH